MTDREELTKKVRDQHRQLLESVEVLAAERDRYREALHRFADHGIHADTTPTRIHPQGETVADCEAYYTSYLTRADESVKRIAKLALGEILPSTETIEAKDGER